MLYFFPNVNGIGGKEARKIFLSKYGLSSVLDGAPLPFRNSPSGPGGLSGIVVNTEPGGDGRAVYDAETQTWAQCNFEHGIAKENDCSFWIGYTTKARPKPEELARENYVDGHAVELSDGNKWLVPLVRMFGGSTRLPQVIGFAPDGKTILNVHSKFQTFYEKGMRVWEKLVNENVYADNRDELIDVALMAIAVNYRVGKWEAGVLGILDTVNIRRIAWAMIDGPTLDEYEAQQEKKTEELPQSDGDMGDTSLGGAD